MKKLHRSTGPAKTSSRRTLSKKDRLVFDAIAWEEFKAISRDVDGNDKPDFNAIFAGTDDEGAFDFFKGVYTQLENVSNGVVSSVIDSGVLDSNIILDDLTIDESEVDDNQDDDE